VPPKRRGDLDYDDRLSEDDPLPVNGREGGMPKTPDEADVRWVRGTKGWLSLRDPFTGERHEIPTANAPEAEHLPKRWHGWAMTTAERWMVRRAMEKLPPRRPAEPAPAPEPAPRPPPHLDDEGPL
jgi:hypothetical protein